MHLDVQSQNTVTAHVKSKQLLPFDLASQYTVYIRPAEPLCDFFLTGGGCSLSPDTLSATMVVFNSFY